MEATMHASFHDDVEESTVKVWMIRQMELMGNNGTDRKSKPRRLLNI
jgi:hypothetical protein